MDSPIEAIRSVESYRRSSNVHASIEWRPVMLPTVKCLTQNASLELVWYPFVALPSGKGRTFYIPLSSEGNLWSDFND